MQKYLEELTEDMKFHLEHERICRFLLSSAGDIAFRQQIAELLLDMMLRLERAS